jgi:uncharacterized membrane protein
MKSNPAIELEVTLYTRADCSLCHVAEDDLAELQKEIPHQLVVVDIDEDPDLQALYGHKIPVVTAGPFTLTAPFDKRKLKMTLSAAYDSQAQQLEDDSERFQKKIERKSAISSGERLSHFISTHYLKVVNLILLIYVGLPFLAPVLMKVGLQAVAQPIYSIYKVSCHELAFRSWFLFGEQPAYPRATAGLDGWLTYGEATGNSEADLLTARNFIGDQQLGYKVAFCQRDIAIYLSMLFFGIIFGLTKRKIKALPFLLWVIIGILPIALDGGSQLLSQAFSFIPYRESTPLLRTLTGALFGITTAWFGFPVMEEAMKDTRQQLSAKKARVLSKSGTD